MGASLWISVCPPATWVTFWLATTPSRWVCRGQAGLRVQQEQRLTDFLRTGTYDARRTFYKTTSPSMDILISSNLERLLYHVSGSSEKVAGWMQELSAATGKYTVDAETLAKIQQSFAAGYADDADGAAEIKARFDGDHYLCDTHTAVAFRVAETCAPTRRWSCSPRPARSSSRATS